jgi:hypothetical protein
MTRTIDRKMDESAIKRAEDRKVGRLPSESLPRGFRPEQPAAPKIRPDAMRTTPMLTTKEERPVIQTLRGWAISVAGRLTSPKSLLGRRADDDTRANGMAVVPFELSSDYLGDQIHAKSSAGKILGRDG